MSVDFSEFDAVLDFSDMSSLSMVEKLAKVNLDMKNKKQFSALRQRSVELDAQYVSYDDLLENLTKKAYIEIIK
jgi:hypothetical protein